MFTYLKEKFSLHHLQQQISEAQQSYNALLMQNKLESAKHDALLQDYQMLQQEQQSLQDKINLNCGIIDMIELGMSYTPDNDARTYKEMQVQRIEKKIAQMLADEELYTIQREYTLDNSKVKGRQLTKAFMESLILGLNSYIDKKEKSVTLCNFSRSAELIKSTYQKYNKKAILLGGNINPKYIDFRIDKMRLNMEIKEQKKEEKADIRARNQRLKEQQRCLEEMAREQKKLEQEKQKLTTLFSKAVSEAEQKRIKAELAKVDQRVESIKYRVEHSSAGWLYIASTPAMPHLVKIGCTRRLNPLIRLAELSSASVPFPFECHGLVYSDNVFNLESRLHQKFDYCRINKANKHKEFFEVTPQEVIKIIQDEFHEKVNFVDENWLEENNLMAE